MSEPNLEQRLWAIIDDGNSPSVPSDIVEAVCRLKARARDAEIARAAATELEARTRKAEARAAEAEGLESIVRIADQLTACLYEFPDDPGCCGEYLDALSRSLEAWKARSLAPTRMAELAKAAKLVCHMHEAHCENIGEWLGDEDLSIYKQAKELILAAFPQEQSDE